MALIELSKVIAADPAAGRRWAAEPLPLTDRLSAIITSRLRALPEPTRAALLLAAVADRPDLTVASGPGRTADALAPAEVAGLIRVDGSGAQFAHPLIRSAVYHDAPFAERAAAHLRIADAVRDQPDRYAWHLAAAALKPDEHVASLLEQSAADTQRRGGVAAAARALARAAELSPDRDQQGRRLLAAAALALTAGQADWVQELAEQALSVTTDPDLRFAARLRIGWALIWSNQPAAALSTLLSVAEEAPPGMRAVAWEALAQAATVAHLSGSGADREMVRRVLRHLLGPGSGPPPGDPGGPGGPGGRDTLASRWLWIRSITDPHDGRDQVLSQLRRLAGPDLHEPALSAVGATAWILDETGLATGLLAEAVRSARSPGIMGASGASLTALGWAYIDGGRWDSALAIAAEASDLAEAPPCWPRWPRSPRRRPSRRRPPRGPAPSRPEPATTPASWTAPWSRTSSARSSRTARPPRRPSLTGPTASTCSAASGSATRRGRTASTSRSGPRPRPCSAAPGPGSRTSATTWPGSQSRSCSSRAART